MNLTTNHHDRRGLERGNNMIEELQKLIKEAKGRYNPSQVALAAFVVANEQEIIDALENAVVY